jgi:hypothetical protein
VAFKVEYNTEVLDSLDTKDEIIAALRLSFGPVFWPWYERHKKDKLISVGWAFIKFSVTIEMLKPFFEMLFGPERILSDSIGD